MEPERLSFLINTYLSEMADIAIDFGGTIDKFMGDSILVFFGDPDTSGDREDALRCARMRCACASGAGAGEPVERQRQSPNR